MGDGGPGGGGPRAAGAFCATRLGASPRDDEREAAELPDIDPAPLDPLPSTARVVCVLDPAVLADADIRRLHVWSFSKDHAWRHLKPLMGAALPHPSPMQAAARGWKVQVSADLLASVAPLVMGASGKAWVSTSDHG